MLFHPRETRSFIHGKHYFIHGKHVLSFTGNMFFHPRETCYFIHGKRQHFVLWFLKEHVLCSLHVLDILLIFLMFHVTFNIISVISWRSVLLVEESGVPGENHRPAASHWQTLSNNVVSSTPRLSGIRTHNVSDDRHWLHW